MSTISSRPNKAAAVARVRALTSGTTKYFPNRTFTIGGVDYTTEQLVVAIGELERGIAAVNAAQTAATDAVADLRRIEKDVGPLIRAYEQIVLASFGRAHAALGEFGLEPPKLRRPLGADERALVTAKMRATRAARHTLGRRQKAAIKGDVTGVVVTPVTTTAGESTGSTDSAAAPVAPAGRGTRGNGSAGP